MAEKLIGHLATHVDDETESQIKALAEFSGLRVSEYLRELVIEHLAEKKAHFERMQRVFGALGAMGTKGKE